MKNLIFLSFLVYIRYIYTGEAGGGNLYYPVCIGNSRWENSTSSGSIISKHVWRFNEDNLKTYKDGDLYYIQPQVFNGSGKLNEWVMNMLPSNIDQEADNYIRVVKRGTRELNFKTAGVYPSELKLDFFDKTLRGLGYFVLFEIFIDFEPAAVEDGVLDLFTVYDTKHPNFGSENSDIPIEAIYFKASLTFSEGNNGLLHVTSWNADRNDFEVGELAWYGGRYLSKQIQILIETTDEFYYKIQFGDNADNDLQSLPVADGLVWENIGISLEGIVGDLYSFSFTAAKTDTNGPTAIDMLNLYSHEDQQLYDLDVWTPNVSQSSVEIEVLREFTRLEFITPCLIKNTSDIQLSLGGIYSWPCSLDYTLCTYYRRDSGGCNAGIVCEFTSVDETGRLLLEFDMGYVKKTTAFTINFPSPVIHDASLRVCEEVSGFENCLADVVPGAAQGGFTTFGDRIAFTGVNFGNNISNIEIKYGADYGKRCALDAMSNDTTIFCTLEPGIGESVKFRMCTNGRCVEGADEYTFPESPEIYKVASGDEDCRNVNSGIEQCETVGGQTIEITGKRFISPCRLSVGSVIAPILSIINETHMVGKLPEGSGNAQIQVVCNSKNSIGYNLVSYQKPTLSRVHSTLCIDKEDSIIDCPKNSAQPNKITLLGRNFGPNGANIMIGNKICINITHSDIVPHHNISCILPDNVGIHNILMLGGSRTVAAFEFKVSYEPCVEGWKGERECTPCGPGTFTNTRGQIECSRCAFGHFNNESMATVCHSCGENQFANITGATACYTCNDAEFTNSNGSIGCSSCPLGKYYFNGLTNGVPCSNCISQGGWCGNGKVFSNEGYWLAIDSKTLLAQPYQCVKKAHCLKNNVCGRNREQVDNIKCGRCLDGFYEWGATCLKCAEEESGTRVFYLILGLLVAWGYVTLWHKLSQQTNGYSRIMIYFLQTSVLMVGDDASAIKALNFVNFDVASSEVDGVCFAVISPVTKLWLSFLGPVLFMVLLWINAAIHKIYTTKIKPSTAVFDISKWKRTSIAIILFSYTSIARTTLIGINCESFGDKSVVSLQPSIDCNSEGYKSWVVVAWICVVFIILSPFLIALILYRKRTIVETQKFQSVWGILYDAYNVKRGLYYEAWVLVRRTILILVHVNYSIDLRPTRFSAIAVVSTLYLLIHQQVKPYKQPEENLLETVSLTVLVMISCLLVVDELDTLRVWVLCVLIYGFGLVLFYFVVVKPLRLGKDEENEKIKDKSVELDTI